MAIELIEHLVDDQVRVVRRSAERITLINSFFTRHPVLFQPIEIAVGNLHDIPIHDRLVVITGSRQVVTLFVRVIYFGGKP